MLDPSLVLRMQNSAGVYLLLVGSENPVKTMIDFPVLLKYWELIGFDCLRHSLMCMGRLKHSFTQALTVLQQFFTARHRSLILQWERPLSKGLNPPISICYG